MQAMAENNNIPQFVTNESFMADISNAGLCFILHKWNFSTKLVENYKRSKIPQIQYRKSSFLCPGNTKRL